MSMTKSFAAGLAAGAVLAALLLAGTIRAQGTGQPALYGMVVATCGTIPAASTFLYANVGASAPMTVDQTGKHC